MTEQRQVFRSICSEGIETLLWGKKGVSNTPHYKCHITQLDNVNCYASATPYEEL